MLGDNITPLDAVLVSSAVLAIVFNAVILFAGVVDLDNVKTLGINGLYRISALGRIRRDCFRIIWLFSFLAIGIVLSWAPAPVRVEMIQAIGFVEVILTFVAISFVVAAWLDLDQRRSAAEYGRAERLKAEAQTTADIARGNREGRIELHNEQDAARGGACK